MYIRIQNNRIRFRVSKQEAESLISGEKLMDSFVVLNQHKLDYSISTADNDAFEFNSNNHLKLKVNLEKLKAELSTRPSKNGIEIEPSLTNGVEVFLEIDIKKKKLY